MTPVLSNTLGRTFTACSVRLDDPPDTSEGVAAFRIRFFQFLLILHAAAETWAVVIKNYETPWLTLPPTGVACAAVALSLAAAVSVTPVGRWGAWIALPCYAWFAAMTWPWTPNHIFLALVCLLFVALLNPSCGNERRLLLKSLRWIAAVVFFYAGLQKALYGYWFGGEYLAWMLTHGHENWANTFGWLVPAEELERLAALGQEPGAGPYRFTSWPMLLLANGIYVGEMALGVLLLFRHTRAPAALLMIAGTFLLQIAPREFMFAMLYTNLLLLFLPPSAALRRILIVVALPLFVAGYALLLLALSGADPIQFLLKPNGHL